MHLRWRLAVVTGAGSGLGREVALRLARVGASVLVVDRDLAAAEDAVAQLELCRVKAWSLQADLAEDDAVRLVAARARDLGGADLLVNNAGGWTSGEQYPAASSAAWGRTLALNLRAPMLLTQLFLDDLAHRGGRSDEPGAVVNVSSSAALGHEAYGSPEYAATKAALVRFTTAMAGERRARVTCVVPGWVGLDRAVAQWEALHESEREGLLPLVAPELVATTVVGLLREGVGGTIVELPGGEPSRGR
ncbi:SDR family oxidoreductase [Nocardioides sp. 503]|uniref:SDR family NAD(P)-dependent oxidoreductase n=1 Tax=Nocardioides sp. 503 TaxID=2508326 RepID=UPI00106F0B74|nr:SDR family oxidoreductase [Nocardioides sp. 503]